MNLASFHQLHIKQDGDNGQPKRLFIYINDDIYESNTSSVHAKVYVKNKIKCLELQKIQRIAKQVQIKMATFRWKTNKAEILMHLYK